MSDPAAPGPARTMKWTNDLDNTLLLAAVHGMPGTDLLRLVNVEEMARKLGPNCSARAIEERLKKLKKKSNARMDETAPHVVGATRKMEAEYRAKREADFKAVAARKAKEEADALAAETAGDASEEMSTPGVIKRRSRASTTTASRSRKAPAKMVKKDNAKVIEEQNVEEEASDASNAGEDYNMDEAANAEGAANVSDVSVAIEVSRPDEPTCHVRHTHHTYKGTHHHHSPTDDELMDIDDPRVSAPAQHDKKHVTKEHTASRPDTPGKKRKQVEFQSEPSSGSGTPHKRHRKTNGTSAHKHAEL